MRESMSVSCFATTRIVGLADARQVSSSMRRVRPWSRRPLTSGVQCDRGFLSPVRFFEMALLGAPGGLHACGKRLNERSSAYKP